MCVFIITDLSTEFRNEDNSNTFRLDVVRCDNEIQSHAVTEHGAIHYDSLHLLVHMMHIITHRSDIYRTYREPDFIATPAPHLSRRVAQ